MLAFPVLIEVDKTTGSGFHLYDGKASYLVTAKHVLFKKGIETYNEPVMITSLNRDDRTLKIVFELDCQQLMSGGHLSKHATADIAVCRLGMLQETTENNGTGPVFWMTELPGVIRTTPEDRSEGIVHGLPENFTRRVSDLRIGDDILLFGYPTSLAHEFFDKGTPLLRSGIIAGLIETGEIVIDCPVYYGNSGGLVIAHGPGGAYAGIGVASRMVPYVEKTYSPRFEGPVALRHENSGYAIVEPMDRVFEVIDELKSRQQSTE